MGGSGLYHAEILRDAREDLIMDFSIFAQQLINGLSLGAIYGLVAIGYSMV